MGKCKMCGRNYTKPLIRGKCGVCARANYMYNQGAITTKSFKDWEKKWIPKKK